MRLALILRGISYLENYLHLGITHSYNIDYRDTYPNMYKHLLQPYKEMGFEVDIFITTYHSKVENELLETFKPKGVILKKYEPVPLHCVYDVITSIQINQHLECFKMIEDYEEKHNFKYDNICITRFDLYFYQNVSEIDLDYNVFNYTFWHIAIPNVFTNEDSFIFYPRSKNDILKECLYMMIKDKKNTHMSSKYLLEKGEIIKYLFGEKGDGPHDYPFYKFGRHIFGNVKDFNSVEDNLKIKMNRIYHSDEERKNPKAIYMKYNSNHNIEFF